MRELRVLLRFSKDDVRYVGTIAQDGPRVWFEYDPGFIRPGGWRSHRCDCPCRGRGWSSTASHRVRPSRASSTTSSPSPSMFGPISRISNASVRFLRRQPMRSSARPPGWVPEEIGERPTIPSLMSGPAAAPIWLAPHGPGGFPGSETSCDDSGKEPPNSHSTPTCRMSSRITADTRGKVLGEHRLAIGVDHGRAKPHPGGPIRQKHLLDLPRRDEIAGRGGGEGEEEGAAAHGRLGREDLLISQHSTGSRNVSAPPSF
jgi:hypothetical protein